MAAAAVTVGLPATAQAAARPTWHIVYTLPGGTATGLEGISAAGQNDAWAYGVTYYGPHNSKDKAAYFRWNGKRWRPVALPAPARFYPGSVLDRSASDVWILGYVASPKSTYPLALHLVGRTWRRVPMPYTADPLGAVAGPDGLWTTSAVTCDSMSGGCSTQVFHWDGTGWSSSLVPAGYVTLAASGSRLWAAGISNIWFRSRAGINGKLAVFALSHGAWTPLASGHPRIADAGDESFAVAGPGGKLWIVTAPPGGRFTLRYFTGRHWSDYLVPAYGDEPGTVAQYLAYDYRYGVWAGAYLRWSGGQWHSVPVTSGPAGNDLIDGVAAVPGSATVWGFGTNTDHSFIAEYRVS